MGLGIYVSGDTGGATYADEPPAIPDRPVSAHGMTAKPFQRIVIDNF